MQRMTLLNLGNLQMQMILELVSLVKPSKRWKCLGLHVCKTLFVTSQHSLHTWSMQWTSPIVGHADSVKLLWVPPCHLTNLFEARKNMTLYMEVRAACICHRTCWLVVTSHFTQLNPCSVCLFDKDKNPADLHQQDDLVINLSMLFHMPLQSSKHFGSVQGIPAFWLGTFQSLKPPSLFITSKASSWPHGFSAATALLIFAMQTAWESDGIWFHPSSGSVSQPRARLTMLTKA